MPCCKFTPTACRQLHAIPPSSSFLTLPRSSLTKLVSALTTAGLVATFSNPGAYTVFAPTDAAFNALPGPLADWLNNPRGVNRNALTNTLKFHALGIVVYSPAITAAGTPLTTLCAGSTPACSPVLSAYNNAGTVTIKNPANLATVLATVTTPNVTCSNGVVHVVNAVLVPANQLIPTQNVVEVASSVPDLSSLVTALVATGLDTVLSVGNGVYTVFAPTNAAFAKIPLYIATNNTLLKQVLLYHVINGRTYAENLLPGNTNITVATLNGQSINVLNTTAPPSVTVFGNAAGNKATVTIADVDSTNAVVHVIDTVSCR